MRTEYWVDLTGIELEEEGVTHLQALPLGSYKHPLHGIINITADRVKRFANNVTNRIREAGLDVDYDHKRHSGKAAGWIRSAEARDDGLWIGVEFTEDAKASIKKGEYKYFSPEFLDKWVHPKTGAKFEDVLLGGGLTNRPYLRDILPINMSELDEGGEVEEFLKKLREKLGLPEDADETAILEAAVKAEKEEEEKKEEKPEEEEKKTPTTVEVIAASEDLKKLSEDVPAVGQLMKMVEEQGSQIAKLTIANTSQRADIQLSEWNEGGKRALPPAVTDRVRKFLSEGGSAEDFTTIMSEVLDKGLVELGERGSTGAGEATSAAEVFDKRVTKYMSENEDLGYADAIEMIVLEDPKLFEEYRKDTFIREEV